MYGQEPGERKVCLRLPQDENPSPWLQGSYDPTRMGQLLFSSAGLVGWRMPCLGLLFYLPRQSLGFGDFGSPDVYIFHLANKGSVKSMFPTLQIVEFLNKGMLAFHSFPLKGPKAFLYYSWHGLDTKAAPPRPLAPGQLLRYLLNLITS